ncbi:hypothetical protein F4782DRAFT_530801 [Xylaria castorea]|nr:hypothetical protein F4782DRAFT_530801 [Xylaria castorea]
MSVRHNSYVPTERIQVAQFETRVVRYTDKPDAKGWIVKTKTDPHKPFKLWLLPGERDTVRQIYPNIPYIEEAKGTFIWGYPLRNLATSIPTCGTSQGRPKILYRLTHDGQPHDGKKPRSHDLVDVDPFSFNIFLHKHLDWLCRNPSPFLSVTDSKRKIQFMLKVYRDRGYQNIKVIKFRSYGPGWDHKKQRLYNVPILAEKLCIKPHKAYIEDEFIIDGEIPRQSIIYERCLRPGNLRPLKKQRKSPTGMSTMSTDRYYNGTKRTGAFTLRV